MYAGRYAELNPERPAFVMSNSGTTVSYREYDNRTNQLAHLLRDHGLRRLDHYSIFMENNDRYLECCGAGERAGLYYTCINSYLKDEELAYILNNSESRILITSADKLEVAREALVHCPNIEKCLVAGADGDGGQVVNYEQALSAYSTEPIADEYLGTPMLYSSGTTGRPKGILRPLEVVSPGEAMPLYHFLSDIWQYREDMVYLSPAPLYHSAPQAAVGLTIRAGGTAIIMERFDPERYLELVSQYQVSHSQLVPTMFSRMLKLPKRSEPQQICLHSKLPFMRRHRARLK